ncbi:centromere DNA-binding like protein [Nitzschia inconspicua]|uniref:Centromere DNA-binding like protein n=2 Tax=Nitzschia inconspicua TaxID=303405 RepID=A0A9K3KH84_9STRA|nr:centromere DNA-binding like protein [Nitzschia inconspicua]KAG7339077.1 centromere DNA-binding like protein [Nitzschia inconspicua]KAG7343172.1 centromere DNA-binding like protein [Nitzschia inconspicua]KAG7343699.1 centromere DNA-binding like protein [Nitzschia inconspicua]KAG7345777.1 centromere DNA-binding like protein [Nitzschia inconspicua]
MSPNNSSNNQGIIDPSTLQTFGEVARFRQAEIVNQLYNENMRANTARSYEPRVEEFKAYCDVVFSGLGPERRYTVTHEKIYPFMFYQCFREKKAPASRGAKIPRFNHDDYIAIHSKYSSLTPDQRVDDPKVCLGLESIMSYKAALQKFHADQRDDNINNCSWQDHVWLAKCEKLIKVVKGRKQRVKRANYDEKVDHEMSPYGALDHIDQIENALFQMGCVSDSRSILSSLRNRFTFLFTTGGILRGESVYMAELSDLLHATVQRTRDPHPVTVMILQMATGKTNKDLKLYGRVARHKNVNLCSIGALGFYLMYRFHYTGEWDNPPDFLDNKSWFDTKLLIASDSRRGSPLNHTQRISDKSYAKAIKKVCKSLGITTRHFVHIGRVLGNKESEIMEDDDNLRRTLGNWDPKQNEKAYSNKLPMKIIRQKAGFREADGLHYNPRVAVIPPTSLTEKVFPCLSDTFQAFTGLSEISPEDDKVTATRFLHFMKVLSEVVIQDAAVIFVEHPNRIHHPLFSSVEVFQSNEFQSYVELMRASLTHATSPYNASLETVLPGLNARFDTLQQVQQQLHQNQQYAIQRIDERMDDLRQLFLSSNHLYQNIFVGMWNAAAGYANVRLQQLPVHNGGPAEVHSPSVVTSPDPPQTTQSVLPYPGYNHPLRGEYVSVMEMFDEWNGTGNYYNIPIAGGIAELNRRYKSQWRRRYTGAQKTLFSRVQRICQSILDRIGKGESKDSILQQYNCFYINDAKGTPSLLVLVLQARGILSKQQRNRNPIAVDGGSQEHS